MLKRIIAIAIAAVLLLLCTSCANGGKKTVESDTGGVGSEPGETNAQRKQISRLVTKNGRTYVEYKGQPFLIYAVALRPDNIEAEGIYDYAELENYFRYSAECGFKTVALGAFWKNIEVSKDNYNYSDLRDFIKMAEKYDLNILLGWGGGNNCGGPCVPGYMWADSETYPRLKGFEEETFDISHPNFIERSVKAVSALMDFLYENDVNNRVVMMQIESEIDNAVIPIDWQDNAQVAKATFAGGQIEGSFKLVNEEGMAVKNSKLPMVTRHNFTISTYWNEEFKKKNILKRAFALNGLDIIGINTYSPNVKNQNTLMDFLNSQIDPTRNVPHIPETNGHTGLIVNLAMQAFARGEGSVYYELRTAEKQDGDWGIYRKSSTQWIQRDGTLSVPVPLSGDGSTMPELKHSELLAFNTAINKASALLASMPKDNIAAFNIEKSKGAYTSVEKCGQWNVNYSSPTGGEAMAISEMDGSLVLLSLFDGGKFSVVGKPLKGDISIGSFDKDGKWVQETTAAASGGEVTLGAGMCARVTKDNM